MMYVCSECGSPDVVSDAWVSVNTNEVEATFDQFYCYECDGECNLREA